MNSSDIRFRVEMRDADLWYWVITDDVGKIVDQSPFGFRDRALCLEHAERRGYSLS
jgi:hypothetical protein